MPWIASWNTLNCEWNNNQKKINQYYLWCMANPKCYTVPHELLQNCFLFANFFFSEIQTIHPSQPPWLFLMPCEKYIFSVAINTQLYCYRILLCLIFSLRMMQNFWFLKSYEAEDIKTYFLCTNLSAKFLQKEKVLKIYRNIFFSQLSLIMLYWIGSVIKY